MRYIQCVRSILNRQTMSDKQCRSFLSLEFPPSSFRTFAPSMDNDESGGVGQGTSHSPDELRCCDCQRERSGRMVEPPGFPRHANLAKWLTDGGLMAFGLKLAGSITSDELFSNRMISTRTSLKAVSSVSFCQPLHRAWRNVRQSYYIKVTIVTLRKKGKEIHEVRLISTHCWCG